MHKDTFYFLHIHANAYFILLALIVSTLTGVRCYLMVLVCIFLMMCNVEHIFMCSYWPFVHLLFAFYLENLYAENITQSARLDEYNLLLLLLLSRFSLQCMKVKSESEVAQSYPTLSDPMDWSTYLYYLPPHPTPWESLLISVPCWFQLLSHHIKQFSNGSTWALSHHQFGWEGIFKSISFLGQ